MSHLMKHEILLCQNNNKKIQNLEVISDQHILLLTAAFIWDWKQGASAVSMRWVFLADLATALSYQAHHSGLEFSNIFFSSSKKFLAEASPKPVAMTQC